MNHNEQKAGQSKDVRTFIAGGFNSESLMNKAVRLSLKNICGVLAHREVMRNSADKDHGFPLWLYDSLDSLNDPFPKTSFHKESDRCFNSLISDPRTFYLAERVYGVGGHSSVFNATVRIEVACWNSLSILGQATPDRIVYMSVTHHLQTWVFGKTAEFLGIPIYFVGASTIPGRAWIVRGIDAREVVWIKPEHGEAEDQTGPSPEALEYLELNARDYRSAIPADSMALKKEHRGGLWSWRAEFRKLISTNPVVLMQNIIRLIRKRRLFVTYNRLSSSTSKQPYVMFFLHYQPEATTLPLGYGYVQQWLAIRAIAEALPDGWRLVVKEHPGMFWLQLIESVRNEDFYHAINAMPNTILARLDSDPFRLIDESSAVATLTGTAGFQALCRGRPVLTFGAASYRGCPGVFPVEGISQVREALARIAGGKCAPKRSQLEEYLAWEEGVSIKGECSDGDLDAVESMQNEYRSAKRKAWERLVSFQEEPSVVSFPKSEHDNLSNNNKNQVGTI